MTRTKEEVAKFFEEYVDDNKTKIKGFDFDKFEKRINGKFHSMSDNLSDDELIEWLSNLNNIPFDLDKIEKYMNSGYTTIPDGMSNEELRLWIIKFGNKEIPEGLTIDEELDYIKKD